MECRLYYCRERIQYYANVLLSLELRIYFATMSTTITISEHKPATLHLNGSSEPKTTPSTNTHKQDLADNPFQRVWRGNREGTIKMPGVPKFDDKYEERTWLKQHMAACFRYWGKMGFGEGTAGHITVRDSVLTDHYWMNPFGMHFSLIKVGPILERITSSRKTEG